MMALNICGNYPPNWKEIADRVKDDARWRCVRSDRKHDPPIGYALTVHHFDGDKSNCERWNLMALCQRCHLSIQGRVNPSVPILFDPAIWIMPYIAGLYEAGRCQPNGSYDLARWREQYEQSQPPRTWPEWAPVAGVRVEIETVRKQLEA